MISQAQYYRDRSLRPCAKSLADPTQLARHAEHRERLLGDLLMIPLGLLRDRDVLDAGCGTAENAMVLASLGARVTLLDADDSLAPEIEAGFARLGLASRVVEMVFESIQTWSNPRRFDLILVEGYLFTLPDRVAVLRRLVDMLSPRGLLVLSYPDRLGSMTEFVRKAVLWRALQLDGVGDPHDARSLALARRLHEDSFATLPSARPFATWWEDCLVSPFLNWSQCWDAPEILHAIDDLAEFYSSSPRLCQPPALHWHKQPLPGTRNDRAIAAYGERALSYVAAVDEPGVHDVDGAVAAYGEALCQLSEYFVDLDRLVPAIDLPRRAADGPTAMFQRELSRCFELLAEAPTVDALVSGYRALTRLSYTWGKSYHHMTLQARGPS